MADQEHVNIDQVRDEVSRRVSDVAEAYWDPSLERVFRNADELRKALEKDAAEFLDSSKEDLERWMRLMAAEEITPQEFEFLIKARKDLAEMHALRASGLALIRVQRLANSLIDVAIDAIFVLLTGGDSNT